MEKKRQSVGTMVVLGAVAVVVVGLLFAGLAWMRPGSETAQNAVPNQGSSSQASYSPSAPQATAPPPAPKVEASDAPSAILPSFDVVRVEPNGDSVIAGRAAPGATIELLRGDQVHARTVADASGLFAITPPPIPLGSHQLALQSIAPDGTRQRSRESITIVIDPAKGRPLVALVAPDKPTVLLSNPEPPEPKPAEPPKTETAEATPPQVEPAPRPAAQPETPAQPAPRPEVKIVTVETEAGKLFVSAQAAPGATIRLYLNESFIAPGGAGGDGKVSFAIASGVRPGDYRVRLDDVDPVSGQVKSRAEVIFNVPVQVVALPPPPPSAQPTFDAPASASPSPTAPDSQVAAAGTVVIPNINTTIVSRGDNLWRISQRVYGTGFRYTEIYGANQRQIRNPDLIYPGQVFVLPANPENKGQ